MASVSSASAQLTYRAPTIPSAFAVETAVRYWFGVGRNSLDLFDNTGAIPLSRLTYGSHTIHSGEGAVRFDFNTGWFLKGYVGGGALASGTMIDEDFPPALAVYSRTQSGQGSGSLRYANVDVGLKAVRGQDFHVGFFAGYHFLNQEITAYGCQQVASSPICATQIPDFVRVITQDSHWHSVRLGVDAAVDIGRFRLSMDAAWIPYLFFAGTDAHWLRIGTTPGDFTGPVPETGPGWGYQLEAILSYRYNNALSLGVGGRYWHMESGALVHFDGRVVGVNAVAQHADFKSDNFGVFLQANFLLGPYPM